MVDREATVALMLGMLVLVVWLGTWTTTAEDVDFGDFLLMVGVFVFGMVLGYIWGKATGPGDDA